MAVIRPSELPAASSVTNTAALVVDSGSAVEKATPLQVVDAGVPLASQEEAEIGTNNTKRVSPLRVAQAIATLGVNLADLEDPDTGPDLIQVAQPSLAALKAAPVTITAQIYDGSAWLAADSDDYTAELAADEVEAYFAVSTVDADVVWVRQDTEALLVNRFYDPDDGDNYADAHQRALDLGLVTHRHVRGLSGFMYRIYGPVRNWPDADGWTPRIIAPDCDYILGRDDPGGGFAVSDEQSGFRWQGEKDGAVANVLSGGFSFGTMDAQSIAVSNGLRCCHGTNTSNLVIEGTIINMAFGYGCQFYRYYDGGEVIGNNRFTGSINGETQGIGEVFKWYGYSDDGDLTSALPGTSIAAGDAVPIVSEGRWAFDESSSGVASLGVNNYWTNPTGSPIIVPAVPYTEADLVDLGLEKGADRAEFTASISGSTMTVTATASGTIKVGQEVMGPDVVYGTYITAQTAADTWTLNHASPVASGPLSSGWTNQKTVQEVIVTASITSNVMTVSGVTSGAVYPGMVLYGIGLGTGRTVTSNGTGTGGTGTYNVSAGSDVSSTTVTGGFLYDSTKVVYIESVSTIIGDCPIRNTLGSIFEGYIDGGYYNIYLGSAEGAIVRNARLINGVRGIAGEWSARNSRVQDVSIENTLSAGILHAWGSTGLHLKRADISHTSRWTGQASVTLYLTAGEAIIDNVDITTTDDAVGDYNIYIGPDCSNTAVRNISINGRVGKAFVACEASWRATPGVTDNITASPDFIGAFANPLTNVSIRAVELTVNSAISTAPSALALLQNDQIGLSDVRVTDFTALSTKHTFGLRTIESASVPLTNGVINCRLNSVQFDPDMTRDKVAVPRGRKHFRTGKTGLNRVTLLDDLKQRSAYMPSANICDATHGTRFILNGGSSITSIQDDGTGATGQAPADGHLIMFRGNTGVAQQITNGSTIRLKSATSVTLTDIQTITLRYDAANVCWIEESRGF